MSKKNILFYLCFILILFKGNISTQTKEKKAPDIMELSMEDLLNAKVITASNQSEKLSEAPATVILISKKEIDERGYSNLIEVLRDLPGMDFIFIYSGDSIFRNYWRGSRSSLGSPYLIMVDGIIFNHLYYNFDQVLATIPISNIKKIEVVYGPASSIYGANAFNGVINIITKKDLKYNGSKITTTLSLGDNKRYIGDLNFFYKKGDIRISLTSRFENGNLRDDNVFNNFEYTKDKYYSDRKLWGGFIDNPNIGGKFNSPIISNSIDLRAYYGDTEIGFIFNKSKYGYGYSYPADKGINTGPWEMPEFSYHMRHTTSITDNIVSKTLLRHRICNVSPNSIWIESDDSLERTISFSYWQYINTSWSFFQDFNWKINKEFSLLIGIKYEQKDLQKAYEINYGPFLSPDNVDAGEYDYPSPPIPIKKNNNRITTVDKAIYIQGKYKINNNHQFHAGIRSDDNSVYGTSTVFRAGYVGRFGKIIAKILYGEAFQEPTPRALYGGWTGTGSDPDLKPEKSNTIEFSLSQTFPNLRQLISIYKVKSWDTILAFVGGASNLGKRKAFGIDYHLITNIPVSFLTQLKIWFYYSYIKADGSKIYLPETNSFTHGNIGDLAPHKIRVGITGLINKKFTATFLGRFISKRDTVDSNPIKKINSYFIADLNIIYHLKKNLNFTLGINNIFNTKYFQPGIFDANSGNTPGFFDINNIWNGSKGWYNSLLPQAGRTIKLSMNIGF